jgi:hypothetical protein
VRRPVGILAWPAAARWGIPKFPKNPNRRINHFLSGARSLDGSNHPVAQSEANHWIGCRTTIHHAGTPAALLVELFALCSDGVRRSLICRPPNEPECGDAFRRRAVDFRRLGVAVYEYALPSLLPSGRETFHAKVVLADASSFYVGSSNFMGSALDRSFECGVIVAGETARQLRYVLAALQSIATPLQNY